MNPAAARLNAMLSAALSEAFGEMHGPFDYDADLADACLDSLRLSSALLAFEAQLGKEISMECIDELAEASTLNEIQSILVKHYLVEARDA